MTGHGWKQLRIVHISDMHFGRNHFFNPPGNGADTEGRSLLQSILRDLDAIAVSSPRPNFAIGSEAVAEGEPPRVIFALTGDFNEHCNEPEFKKSRKFLEGLYGSRVFHRQIGAPDVFLIPGNHDLKYAEEAGDRWGKFVLFYQDHDDKRQHERGEPPRRLDPRDPIALTRIIDQSDEGLVIAEINSSAYVQRGTPDERRGQIHDDAIVELERQLEAIDTGALHAAIKIALIHHHPVVLPVLYEPDDGYDAVLNAEQLFRLLKRFGFHLLLHGHKHAPVTYSYDAVSAWAADAVQPLLIVSGGSAGSRVLTRDDGACNTYNFIDIKWHPQARQARVNIQTRGLVTFNESRVRMPAPRWFWKPLRVDDRLLMGSQWEDAANSEVRDWTAADRALEPARNSEAARLRRNFPCLEVVPSLDEDQAYEGRVWIDAQVDRDDYVAPDRVEWAANPDFFPKIYVCHAETDPQFRAVFAYYGPTLIQARLYWGEHMELAYIFARFPRES